MVDKSGTTGRTDDQLEVILCETGNWEVRGQQERILCCAASLWRALDRASECSASGATVTALCHLPSGDILVPADQVDRLRKIIGGREAMPIQETEYWMDTRH